MLLLLSTNLNLDCNGLCRTSLSDDISGLAKYNFRGELCISLKVLSKLDPNITDHYNINLSSRHMRQIGNGNVAEYLKGLVERGEVEVEKHAEKLACNR